MSSAERAEPVGQTLPAGGAALSRRLLWALALVLAMLPGLPLALMLGGPGERSRQGGTTGSWMLTELSSETSVSQSFVVQQDRLIGLSLPLFTGGLNDDLDDEPVVVRLRTTLRPGPDLASAQVRVANLNPSGPTEFLFEEFSFSPVFRPETISTTLILVVEAPTLRPGSGLMIAGTNRNYHEGVLHIGESRITRYDLAFTPIYAPLLGDRYVPLSRLAQDKPGLLGWPPFYVLLAYGYLLILGIGLVLLLRRRM